MESAPLIVVASAGIAVLLAVVALVLLVRSRAESRRALAAARVEAELLAGQVQRLSESLEELLAQQRALTVADPAFLITDAGRKDPELQVSDRLVLSATLGEPLVKAAALTHGVRRALSAESRNRIWFEMRREVRRSRKQRRRDMKDAYRREQAEQRAADRLDGDAA